MEYFRIKLEETFKSTSTCDVIGGSTQYKVHTLLGEKQRIKNLRGETKDSPKSNLGFQHFHYYSLLQKKSLSVLFYMSSTLKLFVYILLPTSAVPFTAHLSALLNLYQIQLPSKSLLSCFNPSQ